MDENSKKIIVDAIVTYCEQCKALTTHSIQEEQNEYRDLWTTCLMCGLTR